MNIGVFPRANPLDAHTEWLTKVHDSYDFAVYASVRPGLIDGQPRYELCTHLTIKGLRKADRLKRERVEIGKESSHGMFLTSHSACLACSIDLITASRTTGRVCTKQRLNINTMDDLGGWIAEVVSSKEYQERLATGGFVVVLECSGILLFATVAIIGPIYGVALLLGFPCALFVTVSLLAELFLDPED